MSIQYEYFPKVGMLLWPRGSWAQGRKISVDPNTSYEIMSITWRGYPVIIDDDGIPLVITPEKSMVFETVERKGLSLSYMNEG